LHHAIGASLAHLQLLHQMRLVQSIEIQNLSLDHLQQEIMTTIMIITVNHHPHLTQLQTESAAEESGVPSKTQTMNGQIY
jgi:hypothetical protein